MKTINIFISSSFHDDFKLGFKDEREALKKELSYYKEYNDISLDYGMAQINGSKESSLNCVKDSDLMVLFIGSRYGKIVDGENISLTHLEYRKAIELQKPILIFIFPRDKNCTEYAKTDEFIAEIKRDNKLIFKDFEQTLENYKDSIFTYKKGETGDEPTNDEKQKYAEVLAKDIVNEINKNKDKITYQLPAGIKELDSSSKTILEYKKNLSEDVMPYIKRSQFKQEMKCDDSFKTELDFYNEVFNDDENHGILISGEGGIGKTRLMLELGRKAKLDGWSIYEIDYKLKSWDNIQLTSDKICFLFDYVEKSKLFREDIIEDLYEKFHGKEIKIIANSRFTYSVNYEIDSYFKKIKEVVLENTQYENAYIKYVTKKICEKRAIDYDENLLNRPSFAFFIDGSSYNSSDFHTYVNSRFRTTFDKKSPNEAYSLLYSLPFKNNNIEEDIENILEKLEYDGWIVLNDENYKKNYNDTIYDEVMIAHVKTFKTDNIKKREFTKIFNFAIKYNQFKNTFESLGHIWSKVGKSIKSQIMIDIFEKNIDYIKELRNPFLITPLLSDYEKLEFMLKHDMIDITSDEFIILLTKAMNQENLNSLEEETIDNLFKLWLKEEISEKSFKDIKIGSYLLPNLYRFYKDEVVNIENLNIIEKTIAWLEEYSWHDHADYVMKAYLAIPTLNTNKIEKYIYGWLKQNITKRIDSSHLLKSCLEKNINSEDFLGLYFDFAIQYLNIKEYEKNFTFVIEPYLKAHGSLELINDAVVNWLNNNVQHESFSFIAQPYFKADGRLAVVEHTVANWLNDNIEHESFSFIAQPYFKADGRLEVVEHTVANWLNDNVQHEHFSFIIEHYFNAGGNFKPVQILIEKWLNNNLTHTNFYNISKLYFESGGNPNNIIRLNEWLQKNKNIAISGDLLDLAESKGFHYKGTCIEKYYTLLYFNNNEKKILDIQKDDIYQCLEVYDFDISSDNSEYFFIVFKYIKRHKLDIKTSIFMKNIEAYLDSIDNINIDNIGQFILAYKAFIKDVSINQLKTIQKLLNKYIKLNSEDLLNHIKILQILEANNIYLDIPVLEAYSKDDIRYLKYYISHPFATKMTYESTIKILDNVKSYDKNILGVYKNILPSLAEFDLYIDITNITKYLDNNILFLQYYIAHPSSDISIIEQKIKNYLTDWQPSNRNISNNITPLLQSCLQKDDLPLKSKILFSFTEKGIEHSNIAELFIIYLLSNFDFDEVKHLVDTYINIHGEEKILKRVEVESENDDFEKLEPLQNFIKENLYETV